MLDIKTLGERIDIKKAAVLIAMSKGKDTPVNQKVKISKSGCHEWVGTVQSNGYGRFNFLGKSI